jgi:hypothetical protein
MTKVTKVKSRRAHLAGDLPASLGGKDDPTGLKATIAIAVRDLSPQRRSRPIQPTTLDRQPSADPAPPPELHVDRAILVHVVGLGPDHPARPQCRPQLGVAVVDAGLRSDPWRGGAVGTGNRASPGVGEGNRLGWTDRRSAGCGSRRPGGGPATVTAGKKDQHGSQQSDRHEDSAPGHHHSCCTSPDGRRFLPGGDRAAHDRSGTDSCGAVEGFQALAGDPRVVRRRSRQLGFEKRYGQPHG